MVSTERKDYLRNILTRSFRCLILVLLLCLGGCGSALEGKLAFTSSYDGILYVSEPGGWGQTALTKDDEYVGLVAWSPDGAQIAFVSRPGFMAEQNDIYVIDVESAQRTRLTDNALSEAGLSWSPDGNRIIFTQSEPSSLNSQIYVMNADGSNVVQLTHDGYNASPDWSPDGQSIIFFSIREGFGGRIYLMDADGTNQRPLVQPMPFGGGTTPTWSSDGTRIAFSTYDPQITGGGGIGVINSDGTGFRQLVGITNNPDFHSPVWSPDGEYIAYAVTQANTPDQIYVIRADGPGEPELLIRDAKQLSWTK